MEGLRFEAGCKYKLQIFFTKYKVLTGFLVILESVVPVSTIKKKIGIKRILIQYRRKKESLMLKSLARKGKII